MTSFAEPDRNLVNSALEYDGVVSVLILVAVILWIYMPGYLANTFAMLWGKMLPKYGLGPWPIDGGRDAWDGNRLFGDGKTWNGLIGGSLTSGLTGVLLHWISKGNLTDLPFIDIIAGSTDEAWFWVGDEWGAAFVIGTSLGFACLLGDLTGSFIKRRRGLKREGGISSKAPLLDTLPFAIFLILFGATFLSGYFTLWPSTAFAYAPHGDLDLLKVGFFMLLLVPFLHRGINIIGFRLGWKDVPY